MYNSAIIGGGILGLWAARHAIKRGESVVLIEKRRVGSGASGGFLGALMPHMPDGWNVKKQFQYDGLSTLGKAIEELEDDTGMDCGFRRCGRIMPLTHDKILQQVERRIEGANQNWSDDYAMFLSEDAQSHSGWFNPVIGSFGLQYDTLSARVNPRAYIASLATYVRANSWIIEGVEAVSLNMAAASGDIALSNGEIISADRVIIASGWEAYPLLQPYFGKMNNDQPIGRGVKGQALLVEFRHEDEMPVVYHDGCYIVPHTDNKVAIGSTSVNQWTGAPEAFDPEDMEFYQNALKLVPMLKDAPIVGRWAGVRPRNTLEGRGTSPWFGPVPNQENLIALIGGFKITFGVAHLDLVRQGFTQ
ncbi:MAG: NAD(P)/FAD-dependent oxidoreductase [Rhizobiaceae bacterium]